MLFLSLAIAIVSPGCSDSMPEEAKQALQNAESFEFYSLHPDRLKEETDNETFHNWKVLGKTTIEAEETRNTLINAMVKGVNASDGSVAGCFNPRHGIRVKHKGKTHDFVVCFECLQIQWFVDSEKQNGFLTTESPQRTFDKILKEADVPLPPKKGS